MFSKEVKGGVKAHHHSLSLPFTPFHFLSERRLKEIKAGVLTIISYHSL
jgi:hypothetical protein